jgi:hypothetical protein
MRSGCARYQENKNTKSTPPYWEDESPEAITIDFVHSPGAKMVITCAKFGIDQPLEVFSQMTPEKRPLTGSLQLPIQHCQVLKHCKVRRESKPLKKKTSSVR